MKTGDDLDPGTRILCYSDIIAALAETRPYRKQLSFDQVTVILKTQFAPIIDPKLFELIEENRDKIERVVHNCAQKIKKVYKEIIIMDESL